MDKVEVYVKKVDDFIAQYPSVTQYGKDSCHENSELFAGLLMGSNGDGGIVLARHLGETGLDS